MKIGNLNFLRSLRNEAERQADFYCRRGDESLFEHWNELAAQATVALQSNTGPFELILRVDSSDTPIIKACEQHQQLTNHNVIKAFK